MTLRGRLALTILVTTVPLAAGLLWLEHDLEHRARVRGLREFATGMMRAGGRSACEASPTTFPEGPRPFALGGGPVGRGPGRGPPPGRDGPPWGGGPMRRGPPPPRLPGDVVALWAYGTDFRSENPDAPAFPPELEAALRGGDPAAARRVDHEGRAALLGAVRMPWVGTPCDVVLVERLLPKDDADGGLLLWGLAALCGGVLLAVLLAAGPIVGRIRRLQGDVQRAAASRYAVDVVAGGGDEVADLATAFNEAGAAVRRHVADVEERERALRAFVANTTHDVMIPLTVLQGHLTSLRGKAARGEAADPEAVRAGLEEAHYLGSLLQNLAAVAKLEGGATEIHDDVVDLGRLVERVAARHAPIAAAKGLELAHAVPEEPVTCRGDVTLLEQAVSNLVGNAVRYGREGGHASIVLDRSPGAAGGFALRVLDDGPGVPDEVLHRLTHRRFRSEEARTRHPDGLGLGLAIARDVAERHGFSLTFRRLPEGGLEARLEGGG